MTCSQYNVLIYLLQNLNMFLQSLKTSILFLMFSMMLVSSYAVLLTDKNNVEELTDWKHYADLDFFKYETCPNISDSNNTNFESYLPCQFRQILYNDTKKIMNNTSIERLQQLRNATDYNYTNSEQFCASRIILNTTYNIPSIKFFNDSLQNSSLCQLICTKYLNFSLWKFCRLAAFLHFGIEGNHKSLNTSSSPTIIGNKNPTAPISNNNKSDITKSNGIVPKHPQDEAKNPVKPVDPKTVTKQPIKKVQLPTKEEAREEEEEESHLLIYILVIFGLCVLISLVIYNKKKILALMIEGRRRRNGKRRPSTAAYNRLKCNVDETVPGSPSSTPASLLF